MPVLSKTCRMAASANDLWGAIFGATYVYPAAMPGLITDIRVTNRDGVTAGSVREITFGPATGGMVSQATEQITRFDHATRTVESTFINDRNFVGRHFRDASLVVKVDPYNADNGPNSRGSTITWTLTYTWISAMAPGNFSLEYFWNAIDQGFRDLDLYI
ncbi:unnamed protein product [Linum tenue]|uniref:Uncharacterized protein n=1 Tax=Linum tenue TaxID=586396 RepID=A0AAV0L4M3_9ROSI|nr:unnamed protein product [Linum tenue]